MSQKGPGGDGGEFLPSGGGGEGGGGGADSGLTAGQRLAGMDDDDQGWPARAEAAEARAKELAAKVAELEIALDQARETIDAVERRHEIDLALINSGTLDLETARLLTEMAVTAMPEPDVAIAISELRRAKPFLFKPSEPAARSSITSGAMSAIATENTGRLGEIAAEAARTGSRAAVLRYLGERRRTA